MNTNAAEEIVSPAQGEFDGLAKVQSFIEAHEARHGMVPEPTFFLSGAGEHDQVELTKQLHEIFKEVVQKLSQGQSISIFSREQEISTQQAADILGLSRPTVVQLIKDKELQAYIPGVQRRKLRLQDVLSYREQLRARHNQFITDSSSAYDEVEGTDELVREARRNSAS